jgi:hypothetical protein
MRGSTAKFIAYDLRPAKQAERRVIIDFLKCANEAGIAVSDCRYVGMGGTVFYDFHLLHRFIGINNMISLEHDEQMYKRSVFNRPYDFIKLKNVTVADFLASDRSTSRTIYWFDYDSGIQPDVTTDIISLGSRMHPNSFAFVTVCSDPPGFLRGLKSGDRLDYFKNNFGDFAADLRPQDAENAAFSKTMSRILTHAFTNAFAARRDGMFDPILQVQYNDSSTMTTVGGVFCDSADCARIRMRVAKDLPFLQSENLPYEIRRINFTDRERALFDMAATISRPDSKQAKKLKSLGFKDGDLKSYNELIRFLPRYYESII